MWGLRRQASLLIAHGHSAAWEYPVSMLWQEAQLVVERANQEEASRAVLMQAAIGSVLGKEGQKHFKKILKELNGGQ